MQGHPNGTTWPAAKRVLSLATCAFVVFCIHQVLLPLVGISTVTSLQRPTPASQAPASQVPASPAPVSEARRIVEEAYQQTYRHIAERCRDFDPAAHMSLFRCLGEMHGSPSTFPWWFQTLLRDASTSKALHAWYHTNWLVAPKHIVEFCSIEKAASTEWRRLHCRLMKEKPVSGLHCRRPKVENVTKHVQAVFFRDPLERFLSGFVDKCVNAIRRERERHCEPVEVYAPAEGKEQRRSEKQLKPPLVQELARGRQAFLEAYVDTFPLKWNLHFYPAALYCNGLYRTVKDYDFVGHMGEGFKGDLWAFGEKYGVGEEVREVFARKGKKGKALARNRTAAGRLRDYFTPRAVRRLLEYLSIDYSASGLNLPIPDWVHEVLAEG